MADELHLPVDKTVIWPQETRKIGYVYMCNPSWDITFRGVLTLNGCDTLPCLNQGQAYERSGRRLRPSKGDISLVDCLQHIIAHVSCSRDCRFPVSYHGYDSWSI